MKIYKMLPFKILKMNWYKNKRSKEQILINILTRTSNRPIGFYNCRQSIVKQSYKNIKQFVSYENEVDLTYIDCADVSKVKVEKYEGEGLVNLEGYVHAPYNLYCNTMLDHVDHGWILFLDDDDNLFHNKVIEEIIAEIKKEDEDTMFIWQMRYPNGKLLPTKDHFEKKKIEINNIDTTCFIFHSKYKKFAKWDQWKASDYRVIQKLCEIIPKKKWIEKVYIQINNYGDYGNRNDLQKDVTHKMLFKKAWFWFLIPKYHTQINSVYIFQFTTYVQFWARGLKKLKRGFKKIQ